MESLSVKSHIGAWKRKGPRGRNRSKTVLLHYVVCSLRWSGQNGERDTDDSLQILIVSRDQMLRILQHFLCMFKDSHKIFTMFVVRKILFRGSVNSFFVSLVTCFGYNFFPPNILDYL